MKILLFFTVSFALCIVTASATYQRDKKSILERIKQIQNTPNYHKQPDLVKELGTLFYYLATEEEQYLETSKSYFQKLKILKPEWIPISDAYLAMLTALQAKYTLWPLNKLSYANTALSELDKCVLKSPKNIEILYLRATLCHNLPAVFNRKNTAIQDCKSICKYMKQNKSLYSPELIQDIIRFVKNTNYVSPAEMQMLES
ncbi:MAG: hypothetical protein NZ455_12700 [Bacteroidia bacterium]|nr:hypothetical protein [Bacteroidia bacterium]MDW8347383.1 hypothetical protein [Bacteroidia bacterium]